jgi:3-deoxy-D-manno-octulosonic-acid transferase
MFLIYNLLSLVSLIVYLPWLLFKKGPEKRLVYLSERLGISEYKDADIWIHAVSVGEVIAALPFLKALRKEFPELKIVFSTTTYTGQKIAREKILEVNRIMYMPWDTWLSVKRVVKMMKPKIFLTIETELWPCLFRTLKNNGSSVILLNGRISPASFKGYKRIRPFIKVVLSYIDFLYMQGKIDAERIIAIGADEKKVGIMGNFKFDIELGRCKSVHWMDEIEGQILLAGSTHKGEEEIILNAYEEVKKITPDLKLILAPRHPERFNEVAEILKRRDINFIRRSEISGHRPQVTGHRQQPDVILLDTIGELSQIFSRATVSFIGGSLLPYGGHNFLEPAYWGKPIIFGKYMENFPFAEEFLRQGAAVMVKSSDDASSIIKNLLEDPEKAKEMGQKAKSIVDDNTGAVKKALDIVRSFVGTTKQHL